MKTIEERAKEFADKNYTADYSAGCTPYSCGLDEGSHDGAEEGYIQGATEQKVIDIEKACEWLESHFRDIENPDFYSKRNHPTDLESMYHWSVKELVDDFRKAMEE